MRGLIAKFGCTLLLLLAVLLPQLASAETAKEPGIEESSRLEKINSLVSQREAQGKAAREGAAPLAVPPGGDGAGMGLRMLEGLVLCTALFFIGLGAYRKITGDRPMPKGRRMRLVERMIVAPKTSLVLATVDGKEVLLAVGEKVSLMRLSQEDSYVEEMELICQEDESQQQSAS